MQPYSIWKPESDRLCHNVGSQYIYVSSRVPYPDPSPDPLPDLRTSLVDKLSIKMNCMDGTY